MSVAERLKVIVVELVYDALLLMLTKPLGAVVSVGVGAGVGAELVVKDTSLPYDVPPLFSATIR